MNEEFKILRLLKEIHSIFHTQMIGKGLRFIFKENFQQDNVDVKIISDKKRLKQVLINIISNSLKFTV